ncbi:MAG: RidA family protein [Anaerolineales bacterium]|nr:RidA family protein [Anaerolineales bacterium]
MQTPQKEVIIPTGGAKPLAPYSPGMRAGQFVYTSGQIGLDPATGKLAPGGVQAQAKQALENLKAVLEAAGASLESVVKVTIFMQDIGDYAAINEIYGSYFTADPPARSAVQVAALPAGALVEVEAVALVNAA